MLTPVSLRITSGQNCTPDSSAMTGSVGLMTAIPLTTALAAWLAVRLCEDELPDEHVHIH